MASVFLDPDPISATSGFSVANFFLVIYLSPANVAASSAVAVSFSVGQDEVVPPTTPTVSPVGIVDLGVIKTLAHIGDWKVEVDLRDRSDVVVWPATTASDLAKIHARLIANPRYRIRLETSVFGLSPAWTAAVPNDILRLREEFLAIYGVDKENEWDL